MNKILKEIEDNITRTYLLIFFEELDALSSKLKISTLELMSNLVGQDYITMEELKKIDKLLKKIKEEKKE